MRTMSREAVEQIEQAFASLLGVCVVFAILMPVVPLGWEVVAGFLIGLPLVEYRAYLRKRSRRFGGIG